MKRTKHSLSHYTLQSFDMGQLIPVGNYEVLPGDSVRQSTAVLLRASPLVTPVMHPVAVRLHHWFVPYRLIWDEWESFITGGEDGQGDGYTYPVYTGTPAALSLWDYMGVPPGVSGAGVGGYSLLPIRAYNLIFNEFYRDQDLVSEVDEDSMTVQNCAWEKDWFTAARPWEQKGPAITLPLGTTAPVIPDPAGSGPVFDAGGQDLQLQSMSLDGHVYWSNVAGNTDTQVNWSDPSLLADLSGATAVDVNDVRLAFAMQRFAEARAQYGSRYTEYLRYLGVRSSDARLQRPEYLGGGRSTISFSEVLRTGNDDASDNPIGQMAGHGISAVRTRRFVRFFEEHGIVITLASVRPRSMYVDGLDNQWSKRVREQYWQKELEQIGQQPVYNKEVRLLHATPNGVFGYNDRYGEYRHRPSYVAGEFRDVLDDWHLAREFGADPALNASFVACNPSKRVFAAQENNVLLGMFSHSVQARRMVSNRTIGRIF